ncbi:MAG: hypothetical protein SV375_14490, partial [Thermodesulfobacteriota bacterium]|nr:hypothetical protein [Thermodesulfobacteriota bacterium]
LAEIADSYYQKSASEIYTFSQDCCMAIKACIDVYRKLNQQIAESHDCIMQRESVNMREKLKAIPPNKYWRLLLFLFGR